jgi:NTE family protein
MDSNWNFRLLNGLLQGQQQYTILEGMALISPYQVTSPKDFDHLPIPFRAVATDISTGKKYILKQGSLAKALRASIVSSRHFRAR